MAEELFALMAINNKDAINISFSYLPENASSEISAEPKKIVAAAITASKEFTKPIKLIIFFVCDVSEFC